MTWIPWSANVFVNPANAIYSYESTPLPAGPATWLGAFGGPNTVWSTTSHKSSKPQVCSSRRCPEKGRQGHLWNMRWISDGNNSASPRCCKTDVYLTGMSSTSSINQEQLPLTGPQWPSATVIDEVLLRLHKTESVVPRRCAGPPGISKR